MAKMFLSRVPHIMTVATLVMLSVILVQKHDIWQAVFCSVNALSISGYVGMKFYKGITETPKQFSATPTTYNTLNHDDMGRVGAL